MTLRLTPTERRVVELLVSAHTDGRPRTYGAVAMELGCSQETVRWHVKRIVDRMPPHELPALSRLRHYFGGRAA